MGKQNMKSHSRPNVFMMKTVLILIVSAVFISAQSVEKPSLGKIVFSR